MTFRGFISLNNVEIVNSSRVVAHLGRDTPTTDDQVFVTGGDMVEDPPGSGLYIPVYPAGPELEDGLYSPGILHSENGLYWTETTDCSLEPIDDDGTLLFRPPDTAEQFSDKLYYPPNGSRRYGPGLFEVGDCWNVAAICGGCRMNVAWDDSWDGLADFLGDGAYRPEVAPWCVSEIPESMEFAGVWLMDVTGLDTSRIERQVTETVGSGGIAGPHRDASRMVTFDALLIGCTNAGVDYGLKWLACRLRDTTDNVTTKLRYLTAHPGGSSADPDSLVREMSGVILTSGPEIKEQFVTGPNPGRQANIYRVTWEMAVLNPHAYLPEVEVDVDWDEITRQPINWVHAADCRKPETCEDMPVMFSTDCIPENIEIVTSPPPVCGGCLPVSGIDKYSFQVPTQDYPFRCRDTAVSMTITNTGEDSLTLQAFWRVCGTDIRCEDNRWPLQISGLPAGAELHLDGKTGRFWAYYDERVRRPIGVVGTPTGAPWRPPLIDRTVCWEFVVQTASTSEFEMSMTLADREP